MLLWREHAICVECCYLSLPPLTKTGEVTKNKNVWEFLSYPLYDLIWQGPLAAVFDPVQVKSLIRALFQNTERRAEALSNIRLTWSERHKTTKQTHRIGYRASIEGLALHHVWWTHLTSVVNELLAVPSSVVVECSTCQGMVLVQELGKSPWGGRGVSWCYYRFELTRFMNLAGVVLFFRFWKKKTLKGCIFPFCYVLKLMAEF